MLNYMKLKSVCFYLENEYLHYKGINIYESPNSLINNYQ